MFHLKPMARYRPPAGGLIETAPRSLIAADTGDHYEPSGRRALLAILFPASLPDRWVPANDRRRALVAQHTDREVWHIRDQQDN